MSSSPAVMCRARSPRVTMPPSAISSSCVGHVRYRCSSIARRASVISPRMSATGLATLAHYIPTMSPSSHTSVPLPSVTTAVNSSVRSWQVPPSSSPRASLWASASSRNGASNEDTHSSIYRRRLSVPIGNQSPHALLPVPLALSSSLPHGCPMP